MSRSLNQLLRSSVNCYQINHKRILHTATPVLPIGIFYRSMLVSHLCWIIGKQYTLSIRGHPFPDIYSSSKRKQPYRKLISGHWIVRPTQ